MKTQIAFLIVAFLAAFATAAAAQDAGYVRTEPYENICKYDIAVSGYVDMGLSVKWAACSVGASSPEDSRSCFAWLEVEPTPVELYGPVIKNDGSLGSIYAYARPVADTIPADSLMCHDSVYVEDQIDLYEDVSPVGTSQQDNHVGPLAPEDRTPIIILVLIMAIYLIAYLLNYFGIEPYWLQIIAFISGILMILSPMWLYWCYNGF